MLLEWDLLPPGLSNGVVREYRINITEMETGLEFQLCTDADTSELLVGPLHPFYTYHFTLVAFTVEPGPTTDVITVRTEEAGICVPCNVLVATKVFCV